MSEAGFVASWQRVELESATALLAMIKEGGSSSQGGRDGCLDF